MKRLFFFFLTLVFFAPSLLNACEGCKMAAVNGFKEPHTLRAGFALSWSVLFLLGTIFLLFALLGWAIRWACQQADKMHHISQ